MVNFLGRERGREGRRRRREGVLKGGEREEEGTEVYEREGPRGFKGR